MNKQEMDAKIKEAQEIFEAAKISAYREYAKSNNTVKIGDIVKDGWGQIRVERMHMNLAIQSRPQMAYYGKKLTKAGKEFKNGDRDYIYQNNVKEVIK